MALPLALLNIIKSPGFMGTIEVLRSVQLTFPRYIVVLSKNTVCPLALIVPMQPGSAPNGDCLSRPSVLSTYNMVILSVRVTELASGLLMGFPKESPGSTAISVVLQIGNVRPLTVRAGRFNAETPVGHPPEAAPVLGIDIPPTGIPVPAWIRSCSMKLRPARKLSEMSDFRETC